MNTTKLRGALAATLGSVSALSLPGRPPDVLWPWPANVAPGVERQQLRGGLPTPGLDPLLRSDAHARIAAFHRQHLQP